MDDLSQFRSQVIKATLKPSKPIEESHDLASSEGINPNVDGSELASAVKRQGNSLLEQVLDRKEQPDQSEIELNEKRQNVINASSVGMISSIMGSVNHSPKVREAEDSVFKPVPKEEIDKDREEKKAELVGTPQLRTQAINTLVDNDLDNIGETGWEDWAAGILRRGLGTFSGYDNMSDDELVNEYLNRFGGMID